jgi:entry exclusion lipoprotein TrbK
MQLKHFSGALLVLTAVLIGLFFSGCATAPPPNVKSNTCQIEKIAWEVAPQAEITAFSCARGQHGGEDSLIFTAGLKNVCQQPTRFRLTIFLDEMDKAVAYLVPTSGKPPVLAPGADATVKIPFMKHTVMPGKIQVLVTTVRVDN